MNPLRIPLAALWVSLLLAGAGAQDAGPLPPPWAEGQALDLDLEAIQDLPVLENKRFKPYDTLARSQVRAVTWKERFKKTHPVIVHLYWMFEPGSAAQDPVIRLPAAHVAESIGIDVEDMGVYASFMELQDHGGFKEALHPLWEKPQDQLTKRERAILSLGHRWMRLGAVTARTRGWDTVVPPRGVAFLPFFPSHEPMRPGEEFHWFSPRDLTLALSGRGQRDAGLKGWSREALLGGLEGLAGLRVAWLAARRGEPGAREAFTEASRALRGHLAGLGAPSYPAQAPLSREVRYNEVHPFTWAQWLYVLGAFLAVVALLARNRGVYTLPFLPMLGGLGIHIWGLWERTAISGRAMIGDFYESMVFVAAVSVVMGLVFEVVFRRRWTMLGGAVLGALLLILGHSYPQTLDPEISKLQPVLINNDWIHIHVPTIVSSYAALGLASLLGHIYLVRFLFQRPEARGMREMSRFIYWMMPVGLVLLFAGIVLGGVWADQSWGRFWGWDPKETSSLITWLVFLIVIHGRWSGWLRDYGTAVGTVLGGWSLIWTYWGANFFMQGLHSYAGSDPNPKIPLPLLIYGATSLGLLLASSLVWLVKVRGPGGEGGSDRAVEATGRVAAEEAGA